MLKAEWYEYVLELGPLSIGASRDRTWLTLEVGRLMLGLYLRVGDRAMCGAYVSVDRDGVEIDLHIGRVNLWALALKRVASSFWGWCKDEDRGSEGVHSENLPCASS